MTVQVLKMAAANDEQESLDAHKYTFEDLWKIYPRRVAKKDALRAWQKIDPIHHQKIMDSVLRFKTTEDWRKDGGRYIPHLSTFLNGERWEDELGVDLTMGECMWNRNGNREYGKPKCTHPGVNEKNGIVYCEAHYNRVMGK